MSHGRLSSLRTVTLVSIAFSLAAVGCGSSDGTNAGNGAPTSMGGGGMANDPGGSISNGGMVPSGLPTGAGAVTGSTGGPVIPAITADCPAFVDGTVTFMGLAGVQIAAGAKPAAATAPIVFYWHGTGSTSGEFQALAGPVADGVKAQGGALVSFQNTTCTPA
jgi:hypothetical protein